MGFFDSLSKFSEGMSEKMSERTQQVQEFQSKYSSLNETELKDKAKNAWSSIEKTAAKNLLQQKYGYCLDSDGVLRKKQ